MPINKITHVCLTHDKVRARNEKMLEDAKNGMSQEQLAEKYQICVSTVRYSLKDFYKIKAGKAHGFNRGMIGRQPCERNYMHHASNGPLPSRHESEIL